MNNKEFKIYREGHLEGYELGLRDMANYERRFKLEEYKNRVIFYVIALVCILLSLIIKFANKKPTIIQQSNKAIRR